MYVLFATSIDQAQTLQSSADALYYLKIILTIFFSLAFLVALLNLAYYALTKLSPDLTLNYLIPRFYRGTKNIRFEIDDELGRPLGYTRLAIFKNGKNYKTFYSLSSVFSIVLSAGFYKATVSKFGYSSASTDSFKAEKERLDFKLTLKKTQEIKTTKSISKLASSLMIIDGLLAISLLILLSQSYARINLPLQIVLIALIAFSAYLSFRFSDIVKVVKLVNFKNQPLANKGIEITNKYGEPIEKLETDKDGRLHLVISPGIYKFVPEGYDHRSVRINETGLGHFQIKY